MIVPEQPAVAAPPISPAPDPLEDALLLGDQLAPAVRTGRRSRRPSIPPVALVGGVALVGFVALVVLILILGGGSNSVTRIDPQGVVTTTSTPPQKAKLPAGTPVSLDIWVTNYDGPRELFDEIIKRGREELKKTSAVEARLPMPMGPLREIPHDPKLVRLVVSAGIRGTDEWREIPVPEHPGIKAPVQVTWMDCRVVLIRSDNQVVWEQTAAIKNMDMSLDNIPPNVKIVNWLSKQQWDAARRFMTTFELPPGLFEDKRE